MAGNVFRRFLEIVLDKASADKTERDAQRTIDRATRTDRASRNLSAFFTTTTRIAAQATAALAGYAIALNKLVERGGQFLNVQRAFTNAVGDADSALTKLRKATGGLISDYDLMVGFNKALSLGAVTTISQFGEMAAVAQRLGKALGIDATTAMEKLSLGVARHSPKILDDLGITAKAGDSVATILDKARARADEFGIAAENNADRLNRLKVGFTNLKDELAKFLAQTDTLRVWFFEAGNALDALTLALQSHDSETVKEAFKEFGAILGGIFVASFADAAAAVFRQLTIKGQGLTGAILGGAAGFALGGLPGLVAGAAGTPLVASGLTHEMESLSEAAWSAANAHVVALGALRKQVESAQELSRVLHPVTTQNQTAAGGGPASVLGQAIPGRTMSLPGAGVSFPGSLRAAGFNEVRFDELVQQYRDGFADIQSAAESAALGMENAFARAFEGLGQEGETFGKFFADLFKGSAAAALASIAQIASAKVVENIAKAFEEFAAANAAAAVGFVPGSALHASAAKGYLAAAAKWALAGGVASAAASAVAGSGGGGGLGGSNVVGRQVDQLGNPTGPVIHLHIDGVDPNNPRHQAELGRAIQAYQQRYGTRITVNG